MHDSTGLPGLDKILPRIKLRKIGISHIENKSFLLLYIFF